MSNHCIEEKFYQKSLTNMVEELQDLINKKKEWGCVNDSDIDGAKYLNISDESVKFVEDLITEDLADKINSKKLAIVLESPHVKEFDKSGIGIKPAQGYTGSNLKEYLPGLIEQLNLDTKLNGVYEVQLINAIQYQTSLGLNTKIFRDRIWLSCWFFGGSDAFFKRIEGYQPDIIINLCTQGSHDDDIIVNLKQIKAKTVINKEYLETIIKSLIFNKDGSITKDTVEVYSKRWLIDKKNYTLNGFVQTILDKYKEDQKDVILIKGIHPSSNKFSESDLEVVE